MWPTLEIQFVQRKAVCTNAIASILLNVVKDKGNFPLAECNELSGNVFLTHRWEPGYRSCD